MNHLPETSPVIDHDTPRLLHHLRPTLIQALGPLLLAFGHTEQGINTVLDKLARQIVAIPTLAVYLDGDAATALGRAVEREGPDWLGWFGAKLAGYGKVPMEPEWAGLCAYLSHQRDTELRVLRRQPWDLLVVERADEVTPDAVFSSVRVTVENSFQCRNMRNDRRHYTVAVD